MSWINSLNKFQEFLPTESRLSENRRQGPHSDLMMIWYNNNPSLSSGFPLEPDMATFLTNNRKPNLPESFDNLTSR